MVNCFAVGSKLDAIFSPQGTILLTYELGTSMRESLLIFKHTCTITLQVVIVCAYGVVSASDMLF